MPTSISRYIWICIFSGFAGILSGQSGIRFASTSWDSIRLQALNERKLIFMDVYTTWCGPCKRMSQNVFTDPQVGEFFNKNFVNYQVDAERGEGIGLANQYQIGAYPTMLFLDYNGQVVHKMTGYRPSEPFLDESMAVADPSHVPEIAQKYKEDISYQRLLQQQEKEKQAFMAVVQKNPTFAITYKKYALGDRDPELLSSYVLQREELQLRDTNVWKEVAPWLDTVGHADLPVFAARSLWSTSLTPEQWDQSIQFTSQMSSPEKYSFAGRIWYENNRDQLLREVQRAAAQADSLSAGQAWQKLEQWATAFEKSNLETQRMIRDSKIAYARVTGNLQTVFKLIQTEVPNIKMRYDSTNEISEKRAIQREAVELLLQFQDFDTDKPVFQDGLGLAQKVLEWEPHPDAYAAVAFFQFRLGQSNDANLTVKDGMILGKSKNMDTSLLFKVFAKEKN